MISIFQLVLQDLPASCRRLVTPHLELHYS